MYDKCFQRIEEKYLLSQAQKEELLRHVSNYVTRDKHFRSSMRNIYFDTVNFDLVARSIEKPIFKDKFRVRSYDDPAKSKEVFLEMKMKYKGISHKRRTRISYEEYQSYLHDHDFDQHDLIWREIDYYFRYYDLRPMMYVAYDRESYAGTQDENLRITFDANLRSRMKNLELTNDRGTQNYFDQPTCIMEIKMMHALPLWLARALTELEIQPTSFSKYGQIYRSMIGN